LILDKFIVAELAHAQGYRIWISFGAAEAASQAMKALRALVS